MVGSQNRTVMVTDDELIAFLYQGREVDDKVRFLKGMSVSITLPEVLFKGQPIAELEFGKAGVDEALEHAEAVIKTFIRSLMTHIVYTMVSGNLNRFFLNLAAHMQSEVEVRDNGKDEAEFQERN